MFVGIDIGGTRIKGILTDRSGKELSFRETETLKTAKEIDDSIIKLIENLATSASVSKIDIKAIGIGSPGPIDKEKGLIVKAPNIPGFNNHPIVKNIESLTGSRVFLENDATVALIGAWWKENVSKYRTWLMITLGTGIGGGAVIDNRIYTGQAGNAMEVGHMSIDYNGRECPCGSRGCWERYASAPAMVELARAHLKKNRQSSINPRLETEELSALIVHEEAVKKDETALKILEEYATYVGFGLANLINLINPEAVLIGGGASRAHKFILPVAKQVVNDRVLKGFKGKCAIIPVEDPVKVPSFGAAKIAINALNG
ncbi:MAG TPA: ROK family protein [Spirochaetota bacterium]|nr:ROK family protein [Spirochaetota bacterium]HPC41786.1 ROK family protein [Spirochaetota bacterium]HPL18416.1 ROK family protein [Spirochaetota bacterium]HQF06615.1 ROK family protein [Spirochaetota bacterium]HQH95982.1 ROK family protein [Spirochaetota bacterium]